MQHHPSDGDRSRGAEPVPTAEDLTVALAGVAAAVTELDPEDCRQARRLMTAFTRLEQSLAAHRRHVEDVVLPALTGTLDGAVADRVLADHRSIAELGRAINGLLDHLATEPVRPSATLARLVTDLAGLRHLLHRHLAVEDVELRPLLPAGPPPTTRPRPSGRPHHQETP